MYADSGRQSRVTAVLGPTNTGKTYLAIERMLGYRSGMIGFPLRLLARENYDRIGRLKGFGQVALVTGEEKIVPPGARYFFCTVESMPLDRRVAFLAIDEIQLCADPERGHVFTDRLLRARGEDETMLLGAETIRPILRRLVPEADYISRPRFSTLTYAGPRKITRMPPRSAVVAFSAARVYEMAELMRRQRGGTAVVLGALSPRTRNAQVEMFESGEVDYLVATDAIGMGLNLNVDHVAFSQIVKFDGRGQRRLNTSEVAQIAGRAGRHMSDGTFGTTAELGPLDEELVARVEEHRFETLRALYWRNPDLDFRSPAHLLKSLERPPPEPELIRARDAEDARALAALLREPEIAALAGGTAGDREAVRQLWEVCQIPDFHNSLSDQHARLLSRIYHYLRSGEQRLPSDWVAGRIKHIDRTEGDIDVLIGRIQQIRTWTYIAHRGDWLADPGHWQELSRAIEDRLSDALHERLTQRFVDRRSALLMRRLKDGEPLLGAVKRDGEVLVEGQFVGRLEAFQFAPDPAALGDDARALMAAARRTLTSEIPARVRALEAADDGAFLLDPEGRIAWKGVAVARLVAGPLPLAPQIEVKDSEFLDGPARERIRRRLSLWLERHLRGRLAPLYRLAEADLSGPARGLAFQLVEAFGLLPRRALGRQIAALGKGDRRNLAKLGVRLGAASVYLSELQQRRGLSLRARLWALGAEQPKPALPRGPLVVAGEKADFPPEAGWAALGYRRLAHKGLTVAVRADHLEHLAGALRKRPSKAKTPAEAEALTEAEAAPAEAAVEEAAAATSPGPKPPSTAIRPSPELLALAGDDEAVLTLLLSALGYRRQVVEGEVLYRPGREVRERAEQRPKRPARKPAPKKVAAEAPTQENPFAGKQRKPKPQPKSSPSGPRRREKPYDPDSPFAMLRQLKL